MRLNKTTKQQFLQNVLSESKALKDIDLIAKEMSDVVIKVNKSLWKKVKKVNFTELYKEMKALSDKLLDLNELAASHITFPKIYNGEYTRYDVNTIKKNNDCLSGFRYAYFSCKLDLPTHEKLEESLDTNEEFQKLLINLKDTVNKFNSIKETIEVLLEGVSTDKQLTDAWEDAVKYLPEVVRKARTPTVLNVDMQKLLQS